MITQDIASGISLHWQVLALHISKSEFSSWPTEILPRLGLARNMTATVQCRGTTTEMGSLASQMRGLALEASDGDSTSVAKRTRRRGPVVLILDDVLQPLPWESLPGLHNQRWKTLIKPIYSAQKGILPP